MADKDIGDRAIGRMEGGSPASDTTRGIRNEAATLGQTARSTMEESLKSARGMAADNVRRTSEALHAAAGSMGQDDTVGSILETAARRLDRASDALRDSDMNRLMSDINDFARRQPALFIGGAVAAGFALGRLATAGTRGTVTRDYGQHHGYGEAPAIGQKSSDLRSSGDVEENRLSGSIGAARSERGSSSEPSTTIPGHQGPGARPQGRGSAASIPPDE